MSSTSRNSSALQSVNIVFYGAGSMAEAILRGLVENEVASPSRITVMNRSNAERLRELQDRYGVEAASDDAAREASLAKADVIVLAMKPKDAAVALAALKATLRPEQLLVSLIAGLSIDTMQRLTDRAQPIVRTMPNTSSTIGLGATGISYSASVSPGGRQLAQGMFDAIGMTTVVEEHLLESVTAVSGSGPAYIYYMMEAMVSAGVAQGLTPEAALELTVQTVRGAAEMVRQTGESPADLRRKVTSPNGSTQAAIETLERHDFGGAVRKAMDRCAARAAEMGQAIADEALSR
ncbi:pyrroline-5-carboxylate reductase [Cohnella nanjingensis]|uniref:Pyrroline-5-carboxylate reductase n=1 Tax=Cohnella nanjingensis TaxID=1387779 RepID=A0A7X0VHE3_9BACL|nr:pyrroline-5-carboxylate reductase [Cohnella nanjingensis]MBB6674077.1 pyrroline-5-carboxylate reductase [Cohnella nanjingensis]